MGEAVCVSAYCVTPFRSVSNARCSIRARDDPVLFGVLSTCDVADVGRCFDGLKADPSLAVNCDCGVVRCLGSIVASARLDHNGGVTPLLSNEALFRGLLLMLCIPCLLHRRKFPLQILCPRGESRGDLQKASRSQVGVVMAVLHDFPSLFRTRYVHHV